VARQCGTTQKPQAVIDRLSYFYEHENSNVHRAAHTLAARSTDAYEGARDKIRAFLNASSSKEIVFVRGTTEGINLVAQTWGRQNIRKDDESSLPGSNITPISFHGRCSAPRPGPSFASLRSTTAVRSYLTNTKVFRRPYEFVSLTFVSNALGTIVPVHEMTEIAHRHGALVLIDGAQSVSHIATDVQAIDCDFFVFSGHKSSGRPYWRGVRKTGAFGFHAPVARRGNMIADVNFDRPCIIPRPPALKRGPATSPMPLALGPQSTTLVASAWKT